MALVITAAHGAKVQLGNGATSETFSDIDGVFNGPNGPGFSPQMIEARHHGSTTIVKKASYVNVDPVTFSIYYDSGDANHAALMTAAKAKTRKNFKLLLTDTGAEQYAFSAYISMSVKAETEGFNVADVTLTPDVAPTIS